jgi:hypothetical protein
LAVLSGRALEANPVAAIAVSSVVFAVVEGCIVGFLQHRVLAGEIRFLTLRRWVGWTVTGSVIAWLGVSIPMTLAGDVAEAGSVVEPAAWMQVVGAFGVGLVAGPVLGIPQAVAMRPYVERPFRWVPANSLAWGAGMPLVFLAAGPAFDLGLPWGVVMGAAALLLAGALVGLIHGSVLVAILRDQPVDEASVHDALESIGGIDLTRP